MSKINYNLVKDKLKNQYEASRIIDVLQVYQTSEGFGQIISFDNVAASVLYNINNNEFEVTVLDKNQGFLLQGMTDTIGVEIEGYFNSVVPRYGNIRVDTADLPKLLDTISNSLANNQPMTTFVERIKEDDVSSMSYKGFQRNRARFRHWSVQDQLLMEKNEDGNVESYMFFDKGTVARIIAKDDQFFMQVTDTNGKPFTKHSIGKYQTDNNGLLSVKEADVVKVLNDLVTFDSGPKASPRDVLGSQVKALRPQP